MRNSATKPGPNLTQLCAPAPKPGILGLRRQKTGSLGQAAIEFVLLAAIVTLIFGAMFALVRQAVFRLWVCDMTPRIQSAAGCDFNQRSCYAESNEQGPPSQVCAVMAP